MLCRNRLHLQVSWIYTRNSNARPRGAKRRSQCVLRSRTVRNPILYLCQNLASFLSGVFHLHDRRHLELDREFNLQPYWRNQQDDKFRSSKTFLICHKGCKKNLSHLHVISISALCIDGDDCRSRVCIQDYCHSAVNNPAAVKRSQCHE